VVTALPRWVATLLDNISLEALIADRAFKVREIQLNECVGRLKLIVRVLQAHRTLHINAENKALAFLNRWLLSDSLRQYLLLVLNLDQLYELPDQNDEVQMALKVV